MERNSYVQRTLTKHMHLVGNFLFIFPVDDYMNFNSIIIMVFFPVCNIQSAAGKAERAEKEGKIKPVKEQL